jgi:hypothetical protein
MTNKSEALHKSVLVITTVITVAATL